MFLFNFILGLFLIITANWIIKRTQVRDFLYSNYKQLKIARGLRFAFILLAFIPVVNFIVFFALFIGYLLDDDYEFKGGKFIKKIMNYLCEEV